MIDWQNRSAYQEIGVATKNTWNEKGLTIEEAQNCDLWRGLTKKVRPVWAGRNEKEEEYGRV